jgi:polyhydroxyalkanoate synthesis regulator phasin
MYAQTVPFVLIFLTILAGIFLNNKGLSDLKSDFRAETTRIDARLNAMDARLSAMQSDLNQFYATMGRLEGRIEALEKRAA